MDRPRVCFYMLVVVSRLVVDVLKGATGRAETRALGSKPENAVPPQGRGFTGSGSGAGKAAEPPFLARGTGFLVGIPHGMCGVTECISQNLPSALTKSNAVYAGSIRTAIGSGSGAGTAI